MGDAVCGWVMADTVVIIYGKIIHFWQLPNRPLSPAISLLVGTSIACFDTRAGLGHNPHKGLSGKCGTVIETGIEMREGLWPTREGRGRHWSPLVDTGSRVLHPGWSEAVQPKGDLPDGKMQIAGY